MLCRAMPRISKHLGSRLSPWNTHVGGCDFRWTENWCVTPTSSWKPVQCVQDNQAQSTTVSPRHVAAILVDHSAPGLDSLQEIQEVRVRQLTLKYALCRCELAEELRNKHKIVNRNFLANCKLTHLFSLNVNLGIAMPTPLTSIDLKIYQNEFELQNSH